MWQICGSSKQNLGMKDTEFWTFFLLTSVMYSNSCFGSTYYLITKTQATDMWWGTELSLVCLHVIRAALYYQFSFSFTVCALLESPSPRVTSGGAGGLGGTEEEMRHIMKREHGRKRKSRRRATCSRLISSLQTVCANQNLAAEHQHSDRPHLPVITACHHTSPNSYIHQRRLVNPRCPTFEWQPSEEQIRGFLDVWLGK